MELLKSTSSSAQVHQVAMYEPTAPAKPSSINDEHSAKQSASFNDIVKDADTSAAVYEEGVGINEKNLLRKIDVRVIPWLSLLYLLNSLDRATIGNAKVSLFA